MGIQKKVILSLGSNQGDKLGHITACIQLIHSKIGLVLQVSKLYETPAWGFESDAFYNCAILIHTSFTPEQVLRKITSIEKEMGRQKKKEVGYEPRIIDIDIVAFDDQILNTENLIIPHPHMQNRRFVLYPMKDLGVEWVHPILSKNVDRLLLDCPDMSSCEVVTELTAPIKQFDVDKLNYIAIEGNIGAGKTTLASKIAADFNAKLVLERFADNPFLPKFYKDQGRYAFPLEMSFLADRYQQLADDLSQFDLFADFVVADYHIFKSLIFAKVTLQGDEFRLYKTLFDIIYKEMPKPDLYVYLYQNTDRLLKNIKKRGRSYEQEIPAEYLDKINKGYLDYIKTQLGLNMLVIDVSDLDFVKRQEDYVIILQKIQEKLNC
ncbi:MULTISPECIES: 2-amino-4-hydroxy-6-hydroxymethyldihydropteridine diphosphokinase [Flavobacterium]|uniref:2-amino-4-hydroxy-6-hydroxymethyldihydropteridine pyrophosphokinase n=2 Tax=Flavobacterium TaxID=237 RepID=A0AA94F0J0_9FLAO|nr:MULTISPECIES: 2-amino-4-hydroxy-6-hydroxymethyldihydropteridine diphosphokinase [Flavobacterium]OXA83057.1 2-amino-4-hydroxy-6-hydroxymethyldihydropteridine diphosphokinase [Flavobacterium columnare NBRC 100251 = ATCC 23463]AMA50160.1 7,8-dihydro-6-hydroxymethylpterin-pyrophosphokinase [Flavobacterium covae]AND64320.1 7,8-dihydro-6-hydroxymethylpterin-pyrophosphokinase [Flavobacterium covae]MCH4829375.1 2-amino-4-hydroxy-6-hydroxymethyldihydropteridine diphosphokinase [Flavobacterium columna